jgi:hypothetical protein
MVNSVCCYISKFWQWCFLLFVWLIVGEQQPVGMDYPSMMDGLALPHLSLYSSRHRVTYIHVSTNVFTRISLFNFNFLIPNRRCPISQWYLPFILQGRTHLFFTICGSHCVFFLFIRQAYFDQTNRLAIDSFSIFYFFRPGKVSDRFIHSSLT